jgi:signal transduction histidine kinase
LRTGKLFYKLMKSYIFFALTLGMVNVGFLWAVIDMDNEVVELSLPGLLVLLALFGLNTYGYSLWSSRRITRPLEAIAEAIQRMGKGQYSLRLDIAGDYEFSVIQQHFNNMAESLERAEEENRRLQESKRRMLSDLSHDLKTPVTSIQGYAKALSLGLVDQEEKRERYLQLIYNKSTLVTSLIDDIFSLSKLERLDYPLTLSPGDIAELVREIAAEYYDAFEEKGFMAEWDIPPGEVAAEYDHNLMRRAIANLLSNALLHNPPGSEVTMRLEEAAAAVKISVMDNGEGIPDELKDVIFDPFVRGDAARQGEGGSGLGLAIAKQTMELHGGSLELNRHNGLSVFELVLPRKAKS